MSDQKVRTEATARVRAVASVLLAIPSAVLVFYPWLGVIAPVPGGIALIEAVLAWRALRDSFRWVAAVGGLIAVFGFGMGLAVLGDTLIDL